MQHTWGFKSCTIAAVGVLAVLVGPAAQAVTWYSASSPLTAYEGGVAQAQAYGNFYNKSGASARDTSYQRDLKPAGNSVYVDTKFYWYGPGKVQDDCEGGGACWYYDTHKETPRTDEKAWDSFYVGRNLVGNASNARGQMHVCEDQSFSGDPCSALITRSFSY